jgi:hypothetical protein
MWQDCAWWQLETSPSTQMSVKPRVKTSLMLEVSADREDAALGFEIERELAAHGGWLDRLILHVLYTLD